MEARLRSVSASPRCGHDVSLPSRSLNVSGFYPDYDCSVVVAVVAVSLVAVADILLQTVVFGALAAAAVSRAAAGA